MSPIKKEQRRNSLNQTKNRKAVFVPVKESFTEKFKYDLNLNWSKHFNEKFILLKTFCNKTWQKPQLWLSKIDFIEIRNAISAWVAEAFIEGFVINFVVWALLGWTFNLVTMMAWGFALKQILSVYWRLKNNGTNTKLSKKDN